MISANDSLPAHRYTTQVTQRWPWGSEPASVAGHRARFHMQTQHTVAPGDSAFQYWQPAMSTCALPSAHRKKRDCLSFPPVSFNFTVAALRNSSLKIDFLGGQVEGLPLFTAP